MSQLNGGTRATARLAGAICLVLALVTGCGSGAGSSGGGDPGGGDPPGVSLVTSTSGLIVPEGDSSSFTVHLSAEPPGSATVEVRLIGGSAVFDLPATTVMEFGPTDWNVPQEVMVESDVDPDDLNDFGRIEVLLDGGMDVYTVDVTQQDTQGDPVAEDGIALTVKEAADTGAVDYPVTAVIPLKYGEHQDTDDFRILDPKGDPIPAQFEVLNRWWLRDNSLRHVVAHFDATVGPFDNATYRFKVDGDTPAPQPADEASAEVDDDVITVDTGVLRFKVRKDAFNLFDEVWFDRNGDGSYASNERIVSPDSENGPVFTGRLAGDVQRASDRSNLSCVIEENGPMRVVIRVGSPARYRAADDHDHGFAVRIYAFAGQSFVKVDYQIQNSDKNVRVAAPLYFEDLSLKLGLDLDNPTVRMTTSPGSTWSGNPGAYLFQSSLTDASVHASSNDATLQSESSMEWPSYGWADVSDADHGVMVAVRNMAEMWPNGYEVESDGDLFVRLWPRWSSQMVWDGSRYSTSGSGLYWIEDMQHVVKETFFYFHGAGTSTEALDDLASTFHSRPIPILPLSAYFHSKSTLRMGGLLPSPTAVLGGVDERRVYVRPDKQDPTNNIYPFGWAYFGGSTGRKRSADPGGWPGTGTAYIVTERVRSWVEYESYAIGEINTRPIWMADYTYADDFDSAGVTDYLYSQKSWRRDDDERNFGYLPGTGWSGWYPIDAQHTWTYHVEDTYWASGNPWIRDWFEFMAEFRQSELFSSTDSSVRRHALTLANAMQAFRITGNMDLWDAIKRKVEDIADTRVLQYGVWHATDSHWSGTFQMGFMGRSMIEVMDEIERTDDPMTWATAWNVIWGCVDWNHNLAYFTYRVNSANVDPADPPSSGGSSTTLCDPVAWFGMFSGNTAYLDRMNEYINNGLNGGGTPYGIGDGQGGVQWDGSYLARIVEYSRNYARTPSPPAAISNLTASSAGGDTVEIEWTTPAGATRFHAVWSTKPISTTWTNSPDEYNPWACDPIAEVHTITAQPGSTQSVRFDGVPSGQRVYVVIYTFNDASDMSAGSNVASVDVP